MLQKLISKIDIDQKRRNEFIKSKFPITNRNIKVLDIGAGGSPYGKMIAAKGYKYFSQDFQQLNDDQIREGSYSKIDYVCNAENLPIDDESFDIIICTEVLEHVPDPSKVIKEMVRVLKKGGRIVITIPRISPAHQLPYCYYSGFHEPWVEYEFKKNKIRVSNLEATGSGYSNLFKLNLTGLFYSSRFLTGINTKTFITLLSLPIQIAVVILSYLTNSFIGRFDEEPKFSYGIYVEGVKE